MSETLYPIGIQDFKTLRKDGYAPPFLTDPRKLYKIGVSFSSKTRGIEDYIISEWIFLWIVRIKEGQGFLQIGWRIDPDGLLFGDAYFYLIAVFQPTELF